MKMETNIKHFPLNVKKVDATHTRIKITWRSKPNELYSFSDPLQMMKYIITGLPKYTKCMWAWYGYLHNTSQSCETELVYSHMALPEPKYLLNPRFNYWSASPLQNPCMGNSKEVGVCDSPIIGPHPFLKIRTIIPVCRTQTKISMQVWRGMLTTQLQPSSSPRMFSTAVVTPVTERDAKTLDFWQCLVKWPCAMA